MTYRQLLLSTGGGIISRNQMDAQASCATIAIGLGGTGVACLRNLKKQIFERLQPDDPEAEIPSYSHIKFLAVDTDSSSLKSDGSICSLDRATEFFDIHSDNISSTLEGTATLAGQPELKWLKDKIEIKSADAGAGGVRQIGRLLLMEKSAEFVHQIEQIVNAAKTGFSDSRPVNIHIFTGMGGGTGSGTFLDVCYLIQQALRNIGEYGHALTFGYFFLPDVNLSVPEVSANEAISKYIKSNGFAAMKELDYCMNFHKNGDCWHQMYKGFEIGPTQEPPVKICHLLSAASTSGALYKNCFAYAMNVVSDFIMQFVVDNDITMESHIANYDKAFGAVPKDRGANYSYCILGASNAIVPLREISTYLASKLFEGMSRISDKSPTKEEVAKFATDNGLDYQQMRKSILDGTSYNMPQVQLDWHLFTSMTEEDLGIPDEIHLVDTILVPYRKAEEKMVNKVESNKKAMTHPWSFDDATDADNSVSKICKTYKSLADLVYNPSYGPYYAAKILKGTGIQNIVDMLNGNLEETKKELQNTRADSSLRIKAVKDTRSAFLHPGFMQNRGKLFEQFMTSVQQFCTNEAKIKVLTELEDALRVIIQQFSDLYDNHFSKYVVVMNNLIDTFHENYQALSSMEKVVNNDPFVIPLMTIQDLRESLNKTVEEMSLDTENRDFNRMLFNKPEVWLTGEESKIVKCVSNYMIEKFSGYTNRTITDYLQIRFNTVNPAELSNNVYEEILLPLSTKATPMFWLSGSFQIGSSSKLGYCSIPDSSSVIADATQKLKSASRELSVINSKLVDRIFILRCTCGVPLCAYNSIPAYLGEYNADKGPSSRGRHYYEGAGKDRSGGDSRDWKGIYNLQPFSTKDTHDEAELKAEKVYSDAVEMKIIDSDNNIDFKAYITEFPTELISKANDAIKSNDLKDMQEIYQLLSKYAESPKVVETLDIPNDGSLGNEAKVRKDHVVSAPVIIKKLGAEVNNRNLLADTINKLEEKNREGKLKSSLREQFFNAMITGIFVIDGTKVSYSKSTYGVVNEVVLSDPKVLPYGKYIPIYQAFLTFCNMSEVEREAISQAADEKMSDITDEVKKASLGLVQTFNPQYMNLMQRQAQRTDITQEITDFLIAFRTALDDFIVMYGIA